MLKPFALFGMLAGGGIAESPAHSAAPCCDVVELRQYTLHPARREAFIPFFEREFIETQEAVGNTVIGQFRDLDNSDRFTWLRGFPDMPARAVSLQAFYGGDVWKHHRDQANAFFIDTDNVLLLRAVRPQSAFDLATLKRAPTGATADCPGLLVATVYTFAEPVDARFVEFFENKLRPFVSANGINLRSYYTSETRPNNFPRLPVREKDHVFVWFALYKDAADYAHHFARMEGQAEWQQTIAPELRHRARSIDVLRLAPTPRSRPHG